MKLFRSLMILSAFAGTLAAYPSQTPAQTRLWGTYYGSAGGDLASKVVVDAAGNTYITGFTDSAGSISTPDGFDPFLNEPVEAYLAKFDSTGKRIWGTYYGDGPHTVAYDLGLDAAGNIYVLGTADCPSQGLATPNAYDFVCQGEKDMFLAKFDQAGKRVWGTYFGGSGIDVGQSLSVTLKGVVYVIGGTTSADGLVPLTSPDPSIDGATDAVIARFSAEGKLEWARYFGGEHYDWGYDIACRGPEIGPGDACYVTGLTESNGDVATIGAHDTVRNAEDAFLAKISTNGGKVIWGTYYGGGAFDRGESIVVDKNLNVYLAGITQSLGAIATAGTHDVSYNGNTDLFLAKFDTNGKRLAGTYFGNNGQEQISDLALDAGGNVYMLGIAEADGNLATPNAYDETLNGPTDFILAKFNPGLIRLWATYYGGHLEEWGTPGLSSSGAGIAIDSADHVYLHGSTTSEDGISTPGSHQPFYVGYDAFLVEFSQ